MDSPLIEGLLQPGAYPHACGTIELIETHISWVLLTGEFAYKVKKPVSLNFVDFSTLERRAYFCQEELRCNRAFAPELYDAVVPINLHQGCYRVEGPGQTVEWAVRMIQFPTANQLDRLLDADGLVVSQMHDFGGTLASTHARLPRPARRDDVQRRVLEPALDNFRTLAPLSVAAPWRSLLAELEAWCRAEFHALRERFAARGREGYVRECHGDLHLSNLVMTDAGIRAFDCLEFNENLRWIDTASDVAFLVMDCRVRGRDDLAYAFLDGYLSRAGDYDGAVLTPFYQCYRSMVRAKVAALRLEQDDANSQARDRLAAHLGWTEARLHSRVGSVVLMCGVSGAGKSYVAQRLVPLLPGLRIRSDVARKRLAGLAVGANSRSPVDAGLYARGQTERVYGKLLQWTRDVVQRGDHVIVDATFLERGQRKRFLAMAGELAAPAIVVACRAPLATLNERLQRREQDRQRTDHAEVSEAGVAVMQRQLQRFEPLTDEPVMNVNTAEHIDFAALAGRLRGLLQARPQARTGVGADEP